MSILPPAEGEFTEEIFGTAVYEATRPQKKNFLPWHRPRKQLVRDHQWCTQIKALLNDIDLAGSPLKYLGLPGVDLLDLRFFHSKVCEPNQLNLCFLGFNSSAHPASESQTELNISLDEVRKLQFVDQRSDVIGDDFRKVAKENSIAWKRTHALGPYDVINLDLCDGFAAQEPGVLDETHYDAMNRLLSLQSHNKNPWLLLLTTRAGKQHIHEAVWEKLLQKFLHNLASCADFKTASTLKFEIENELGLLDAIKSDDGLLRVFLTGLCKWLVGIAVGMNPPWRVELKSVFGYRVEQGSIHEDLISLALRFQPTFQPVGDPLGIANQPINAPNECELSVKVLNRVANRKDADSMLTGDGALNNEMILATAALLEIARYDVNAYHAWVQCGCK